GLHLRKLQGHLDGASHAVFTPDGSRVVSCSWDKTVRVWDWLAGREVACLRGHSGEVYAVAVSPDGAHGISGGEDRVPRLWDLARLTQLRAFESADSDIRGLKFLSDGSTVVGVLDNGSMATWNVTTGGIIENLKGESIARSEPTLFRPHSLRFAGHGRDE